MDFSTEDAFRAGVVQLLDNCTGLGLNTVLAQVRPFGDALYRSSLFPWSHLCTGVQGQDPGFDPLDVLLQEAHTRGISVEAWVNPYRLRSSAAMPPNLADGNLANTHPEWVCTVDEGLYLNPAEPAAADYVVQGVAELVQNYAVDGIHFDDYFYPTTEASFDSAAYSAYRKDGGKLSLADYRRDCLSKLVAGLYDTVKAAGADILFGISPAGNINTVYEKQYADVYRWCSEAGYLDYICPQVYFGLEHQTYDFKKVSNTFQSIIKLDSVELIIGMTLGKAKSGTDQYAGTGKNEWSEHKDILMRCLEYTESLPRCRGVAYFCYQYFYDPISGVSVKETQTERNAFVPLLKTISWTGNSKQ